MPSFPRAVPSLLLAPILCAEATSSPAEALGPLATERIARGCTATESWALRAVVRLSLGASFRPQLERFVRTFFEHRDAGLCR